jgi:ferrochelatase
MLVNVLIVPFRMFSSAKEYKKLWTSEGSPLDFHSKKLRKEVQNNLPDTYTVHLAMRYQKPSIKKVLAEMKKAEYEEIIILPLYPQYAASSGGTAIQEVMKYISKWWAIPKLTFISEFHKESGYINSIVDRANQFELNTYDHIVLSFHVLPTRHVDKVHSNGGNCESHNCRTQLNSSNKLCYVASCYSTKRLLVEKLDLKEDNYSITFQSRLNDKWLKPYTDKTVIKLAKSGKKNILVFSPAFVADCLETTIEIGEEFQDLFIENGGTKLDLVPSLNSEKRWVKAVSDLIQNQVIN